MDTITGYEKIGDHTLKAIKKQLGNAPKTRHQYINGKLWIVGIGNLFNDIKTAEKNREKKYEKMYEFSFFSQTFYGNVPKYDFKNIIKQTLGE